MVTPEPLKLVTRANVDLVDFYNAAYVMNQQSYDGCMLPSRQWLQQHRMKLDQQRSDWEAVAIANDKAH